MAVEVLMPKLGLTMKTGTVVKWLKDEGETVKIKEPVLEIETEKLSHEIESPADGVLLKKIAVVGEKYPIAFVVGYIGQPGEQISAPAARTAAPAESAVSAKSPVPAAVNTAPEHGGRVFISPVAKKLSAALNLDYKLIKGTGPNGRIVKADVQKYADTCCMAPSLAPEASDTVIPYNGIRRAIGVNMLQSWTTIPMVTHQVMADVSALLEYRTMINRGITEKSESVSINDLLMKITAAALERHPSINSSLADEGIILHKRVHLGMATALENGLIVPVIHDANRKNLLALSREAKDLAARARNGGLGPDELQGATFTVSNLGGYGSVDLFTPIINPPQAGILGIGRVMDTAVPVSGEIKVRPQVGLSFTYDHRIIDGAVAAEFIRTLMQLLENPARAVLL
ncbi:pyruvate dehydrogenase E2 component (dihydrolipoamide acetyltransferase) [Sporobacter termitidis DSM 10068]|uniref:Dihydrolipoamide acetyltransferase component of pyruvate dehydrogenase complex n=1 Tax=Sporobacter termitidis DSM 10068 TaxID=1123282 RepID=A0A1M5YR95_9FIRM|nr:dihydrolipoamide acetyltransferase family protein [Sporobacter termitidis]SHI14380.1 pyruvate dehydrogenase E2 component (dihydrolipoamide acetyltransferase) [Sporobacter termitidis DSM 10068]